MTIASDYTHGSEFHGESIMAKYDLAILGGGPGGYVAAIRASQLGLKTCIVEKGLVGGTCLNRGCIPTKALLHAAELMRRVRDADRFGITIKDIGFDLRKMMDRKTEVVIGLRQGTELLLKKRDVDVIHGIGTLVARNTMRVETKEQPITVKSSKTIIGTGSEPLTVPAIPTDGESFISSTEALLLRKLPESLLIIGGGYVGCELAAFFSAFGVDVTILEMTDQLLPGLDPMVARTLQRQMEKRGVKMQLESKVEKASVEGEKAVCQLSTGEELAAEKVLVAIGRKLNSDGIGLQEIGVETDNGAIVVDERMETSLAGTYAVGDVVNKGLLAHVANHQGIVAAENAAGGNSQMDYHAIPYCIYTSPEVAMVGLNRREAEKQGHEVVTGRFPFAALGKAVISGDTDGFAQVVADARTGEILGAQIVGADATNLISEVVAVMKCEGTLDELSGAIHPHPTLPEAIMEAAFDAKGEGIHILSAPSKKRKGE
jgi:dihydrolipoamide dehydrogenase